jgi:hypothetical protein
MFSTSGLPLPQPGGESVVADRAADSGKVGPNDVVGSSSRSARLFAVETVDKEAADTSEAHDDADASESSDYRRIRVCSSSSSGVPNVVVVANEAVEVAALPVLPFPPQVSIVSIVSIDGFESAEPSVFLHVCRCASRLRHHIWYRWEYARAERCRVRRTSTARAELVYPPAE